MILEKDAALVEKFQLEGQEFIKLCDLLKTMGLCENGGQAKSVIADGSVKVNGEVELRKRFKVLAGMKVEFNGNELLVEL